MFLHGSLYNLLGDCIDILLAVIAKSDTDMSIFHKLFTIITGIGSYRFFDAFFKSQCFFFSCSFFSPSECFDDFIVGTRDIEVITEIEIDNPFYTMCTITEMIAHIIVHLFSLGLRQYFIDNFLMHFSKFLLWITTSGDDMGRCSFYGSSHEFIPAWSKPLIINRLEDILDEFAVSSKFSHRIIKVIMQSYMFSILHPYIKICIGYSFFLSASIWLFDEQIDRGFGMDDILVEVEDIRFEHEKDIQDK